MSKRKGLIIKRLFFMVFHDKSLSTTESNIYFFIIVSKNQPKKGAIRTRNIFR